jgi:hypothetical protein
LRPLSADSTCAFHRTLLLRVSFSLTGNRKTLSDDASYATEEDEAKAMELR